MLAWFAREKENILTSQPCLHTLMQTLLLARKVTRDDRKYVCVQSLVQVRPLPLWPSFFGEFLPLRTLTKEIFVFLWIFKLGTVRIDKVLLLRRKRWILAMNDDPDIKTHKSFANEHLFDVWFLFQILNTHSLWFWTTNDPPWSAYYSGKGFSANNPLNERIFNEIVTMIAQKRTRKCTPKCRHFQCLRENNKGFEEPEILHHHHKFSTMHPTVLKTVAIVLYAEAIKFFKR